MSDTGERRRFLLSVVDWWERDRSRLMIIRIVAFGLFFASFAGTIYAGIKGTLPVWGLTLYVFFTVQLVFMTFMYAIRHSGEAEIRRAVFDLRRNRQAHWKIEREILGEFARIAACQAAGLDPQPASPRTSARRSRPVHVKYPLPAIANKESEVRRLVRGVLTVPSVVESTLAGTPAVAIPKIDVDLLIQFAAYSSETIIELSREIVSEIEDILAEQETRFEGIVKVHILVRDTSNENTWLVPIANDERADEEYATELRTRFRNVQRSALREFEESLKTVVPARQVQFAIRGYLAEPLLKGIMVNGSAGMVSWYTISELRDPDGWDYSGHGMEFCIADLNGNPYEKAAASFFTNWFELMWDERNSRALGK